MAQTVRLFVTDQVSSNPIEGAHVALFDTSGGQITYAITDSAGVAVAILPEGTYVVSVSKPGYTSLTNKKLEVVAPPAASAAVIEAQVNVALADLGPTSKLIEISVDGGPFIPVDVTGGDDYAASVSEVVSNINSALGAPIASELIGGRLRLTSPTTGASSSLVVKNDGTTLYPAIEPLFGVENGSGDLTAQGSDSNPFYNDFDVFLDPKRVSSPTSPVGCVVHGVLFYQTSSPLKNATFLVYQLDTPRTVIDGAALFSDAIHVTTDQDGYFEVELTRKSRARIIFPWLDQHYNILVPDAPSANIVHLLSPYVVDLTEAKFGTGTIELKVNEAYDLRILGIFTDSHQEPLNNNLSFSSSDDTVAAFLDAEAPSRITGVAVGTAQLLVQYTNDLGNVIHKTWQVEVT